MRTQKLSVSLPQPLYEFVEQYQIQQHCKTRSEVVSEALRLLQQHYLEQCYQEANAELDDDFDSTISDGLDDETW